MILRFPDLDTLKIAITSCAISSEVAGSPAQLADHEGALLIEPSVAPNRGSIKKLKELGVERKRSTKAKYRQLSCWYESIPAEPVSGDQPENTEVLFEIGDSDDLMSVVSEMMRLGNDRQSFRHFDDSGQSKSLLRVNGPPYYTMLRAVDREGKHLRGFVEQAPRVWAPIGFQHPFASRMRPDAGQWLLLSSDQQPWRFVDEGRFTDIYETLEFSLPNQPSKLQDKPLEQRIPISMSLARGGTGDVAELWVITHDSIAQVEKLIRRSDNELISRLAFAVGQSTEDGPVVLLRTRPSKHLPPVLVINGIGYRSYLKVPNLFMPIGYRLHPPLRRDAVIQLLASDTQNVTWLSPQDNLQFQPHQIPDSAFRPLSDWVEYVLDYERESITAWTESFQFDFESFVCPDTTKKARTASKKPSVTDNESPEDRTDDSPISSVEVKPKKVRRTEQEESDPSLEFVGQRTDNSNHQELQKKLRQLEQQYNDLDAPLDSPHRDELWQQMAVTNAAISRRSDSTICWSNALWNQSAPDLTQLQRWIECEQHGASIDSITAESLDQLLDPNSTHPVCSSLVAAIIVWGAAQNPPSSLVVERLADLSQFLYRHESNLPIRTVWMAWCALYQLSSQDVLMLARARDRMLERLYSQGMTAEFDMASFLRVGGAAHSDRFRILREKMVALRSQVASWINEPVAASNPQTKGYADLMFAYAFACIGETSPCNQLLSELEPLLIGKDVIHKWVFRAFAQRIKQAIEGDMRHGQLSSELLDQLSTIGRMDRYKLDKLRQRSHILEPHVRIDPYRNWHQRFPDDLARDTAQLQNLSGRDELHDEIIRLLETYDHPSQRMRVLPAALQVAPRVSEPFCCSLLQHVDQTIRHADEPIDRAMVLQQALYVAAHYGRIEYVHEFMKLLDSSLDAIVQRYLQLTFANENIEKIQAIESLFEQSFRGLRKLGMRDEISQLYGRVAELVNKHEPVGKKGRQRKNSGREGDPGRPFRLLLNVAGGWYYFGQNENAQKVVNQVRDMMFDGDLQNIEQKNLATAYLRSVSQAPIDEAIARVEELFATDKRGVRKLPNIGDNMTTSSHFSISQLELIEAAVLALVNEDFSLSTEARRWLDEDEFIVRCRIHGDVRQATASTET